MIFFTDFEKYNIDIDTNTIIALDIEVSSYWIDGTKIIEWDSTLSDEYYNSILKGSCIYIWQVGIKKDEKEYIFYGREWADCQIFIDTLQKHFKKKKPAEKMYIYIHNASYEFQFFRNFNIEYENVFARLIRKPMKFSFNDVEVRCSYMLTHLSLESWGKQLNIPKQVGALDYVKIRSPKTKLSAQELKYCEYDIKIMLKGLQKFLDKYGTIKKIPLTSTGEVRKIVKDMYRHEYGYHNFMTKLLPRNVEEYKIAKQIFAGGDTHANVVNVNTTIAEVDSMDETSEYPAVCFRCLFPKSPFMKTIERAYNFDRYCYIFFMEMKNVKLNGTISYLARSRCVSIQNGVFDNGRIVSADYISLYCTCQDYKYIKKMYQYDENMISVRKAIKGHLDKKYIELILDLFKAKSTLKGVEGMEDIYLSKKGLLNSLYGMMVQDLCNPNIKFDNTDWSFTPNSDIDIQKTLDELHEKKYKNNLSYFIGCYVTAYARADLWEMITRIIEAGGSSDICYFDTDSLKLKNFKKYKHLFDERNEEIIEENKKTDKHFNFESSDWIQTTNEGDTTILGTWAYDGHYEKFKTLGAKKYMYEDSKGFHITVSGVPKKAVKCLKSFDDFKDGFVFTADECRKGLATYLDGDNPTVVLPDGYTVNQPYGLNIRNIGYTLGITEEFMNIINNMKERGYI